MQPQSKVKHIQISRVSISSKIGSWQEWKLVSVIVTLEMQRQEYGKFEACPRSIMEPCLNKQEKEERKKNKEIRFANF